MIAEQIRKAKSISEVVKLLERTYDEEVLSGKNAINMQEFLYDFNAVPFELRSEILYDKLVMIFGAKLITYVPEEFKNEFLCYILTKHAEDVDVLNGRQLITLKHKKGSFIFIPKYRQFVCQANVKNFDKVYNDKNAFLNLPTAEFSNKNAIAEYDAFLKAKAEEEENKAKDELSGFRGVAKALKTYRFSSKQKSFESNVMKKISNESNSVEENNYYYLAGCERLEQLQAILELYKPDCDTTLYTVVDCYSVDGLKRMEWNNDKDFIKLIEDTHSSNLATKYLKRWKYLQLRGAFLELKSGWLNLQDKCKITEKEYKKLCSSIKTSINKVLRIEVEVSDVIAYHYRLNER